MPCENLTVPGVRRDSSGGSGDTGDSSSGSTGGSNGSSGGADEPSGGGDTGGSDDSPDPIDISSAVVSNLSINTGENLMEVSYEVANPNSTAVEVVVNETLSGTMGDELAGKTETFSIEANSTQQGFVAFETNLTTGQVRELRACIETQDTSAI